MTDGPGLEPGLFCDINGFIGQFSVQAADLSTFSIAIVTFLGLSSESTESVMKIVNDRLIFILIPIWLIPLVTAIVAKLWVGFTPVGNWCWIANRPVARYSLTHGLRIVRVSSLERSILTLKVYFPIDPLSIQLFIRQATKTILFVQTEKRRRKFLVNGCI